MRGFKEESIVGKGSFSCVFKGDLKHGTIVAVKRTIMSPNVQKNSKEFHTELDLLNLLGYCEEGGERLVVYECMAHGSLHQHLHGNKVMQEQMDWVTRVTIAMQATHQIEYLHGYVSPPVIHKDIKSSNILIDEEHNVRVADLSLSLLGLTDIILYANSLIQVLSKHSTEQVYLGQRENPKWTLDAEPLATFERFWQNLLEIERHMMERNTNKRLNNRNRPMNMSRSL
ncbi:Serine/threonine-protein kinase-like protein ACR4 [Glycine max]|nr:Serine/threonine-protein kinase-like protein ACR4 [Glycine max]